MKWRYFIAAAVVAAAVLLGAGAPPLAIGLGVLCALVFNLFRTKASRDERG